MLETIRIPSLWGGGGRIGECMEDVYMGVAMRTDTCMPTHIHIHAHIRTGVHLGGVGGGICAPLETLCPPLGILTLQN